MTGTDRGGTVRGGTVYRCSKKLPCYILQFLAAVSNCPIPVHVPVQASAEALRALPDICSPAPLSASCDSPPIERLAHSSLTVRHIDQP